MTQKEELIKRMDFNKLLEFAIDLGFSINISFSESDYSVEVETVSAAKSECYYEKRITSADHFIKNFKNRSNP